MFLSMGMLICRTYAGSFYGMLHIFHRVQELLTKILNTITPHIRIMFVLLCLVELEEKDFYNIKVQKGK